LFFSVRVEISLIETQFSAEKNETSKCRGKRFPFCQELLLTGISDVGATLMVAQKREFGLDESSPAVGGIRFIEPEGKM